jgi:hypothetical protein
MAARAIRKGYHLLNRRTGHRVPPARRAAPRREAG